MKLVRNTDPQGRGKYALVNLEKLRRDFPMAAEHMPVHAVGRHLHALETLGLLTYGAPGDPEEFFVIKLKDAHAKAALEAYAASCAKSDWEFATEVQALAERAGTSHPLCKHPD